MYGIVRLRFLPIAEHIVILQCGLICISLFTDEFEHVFISLFVFWNSSLVNCLFVFFICFSVRLPVFFLVMCKSSLYILLMSIFHVLKVANIFFYSELFFSSLYGSFLWIEVLNFGQIYQSFLLCFTLIRTYVRNSSLAYIWILYKQIMLSVLSVLFKKPLLTIRP